MCLKVIFEMEITYNFPHNIRMLAESNLDSPVPLLKK